MFYIPDIYIINDRTKQDRAVVNQEERKIVENNRFIAGGYNEFFKATRIEFFAVKLWIIS